MNGNSQRADMAHRGQPLRADLMLALDPGSVRTGWAVLDLAENLREAGVLTPDRMQAPSHVRIGRMCQDLLQLLGEWEPAITVIEWTSGKVGHRRHKGHGAGLAVHGAATGALWQAVEAWRLSLDIERQNQTSIVLVLENVWTAGIPKQERLAGISAVFTQYDLARDIGGDVGDAIGLGLWYLREHRVRQAADADLERALMSGVER